MSCNCTPAVAPSTPSPAVSAAPSCMSSGIPIIPYTYPKKVLAVTDNHLAPCPGDNGIYDPCACVKNIPSLPCGVYGYNSTEGDIIWNF